MEITFPLMDWIFAILAHENTERLFWSLFLRNRVVHATRTGKVDGCLGAIAHLGNMRCGQFVFQRTSRIDAVNSLPQ